MKRVVHAACPHDCPDACGVLITVEDGRATKIQGDPAHPVTRGFLCAKVAKYLDRVYSPQRVLYPLRRVEPKGPKSLDDARQQPGCSAWADNSFAAFVRITWDEALDEIAARFKKITSEFGAEAILPYSYGGTLGVLNNASMDRRFFHRLGASRLNRTICSEAGGEGLKSVIGAKLGTEPEQFRHARLIIAWGANIHGNNVHLWPFVEEARRAGAKLVVIDPYRTRTAACADWYLPINPGTDVALALGLMHVIIGERLYDAEYVAQHTVGFDELRARVRHYAPEQVERWTGIAAGDIVKLARDYGNTRPAAIRLNYGVQRCENGGMAVRAIAMLPCITGSWKDVGGGLQLSTSGGFPLDRAALERADLAPDTRVVNMVELGRALNHLDSLPIKALFVYNSNPAAVCPDHNAVVRGLMRPDLFTVVHEQFLTDTCDYADIVLPATTFFEHKDLQPAYGHYYLQVSNAAIEPLGECRSNVETFRALAERLGFEDRCFRESADDLIDAALATDHPWLQGITRERLEQGGHLRLNFPIADSSKGPGGNGPPEIENQKSEIENEFFLPFARGNFPTASGKAELYSAALAAQGLDPVASFQPPLESRHTLAYNGYAVTKYPLELLARKADNFLNSTFCNLPANQEMVARENSASASALAKTERGRGPQDVQCQAFEVDVLEINAADADARRIRDGDTVRVYNDRGEIWLRAVVHANGSAKVQPGVVAARLNWAKLSREGRNVNVLTSERLTDIGGGPTFYSTLVEVEIAG